MIKVNDKFEFGPYLGGPDQGKGWVLHTIVDAVDKHDELLKTN